MSIDTRRTPQEYEVLSGGGAEAAELGKRGISRRQLLRRATALTLAVVGAEATFGALTMLYPNLAGQFGSVIQLKTKDSYPAAAQKDFALDQKGIFYEANAKSYIMHMASGGALFLMSGTKLTDQLDAENWLKDSDGSYWLALYQVCVHLGCKVPFRDDCNSFKCPCHGSHYNVDGEYLDGPAPRSLDRFEIVLKDGSVNVDTSKLNQHVERPDAGSRVLQVPGVTCSA
ncbi:MAG TPA: ubiquinol-cytochrome c reductase iron-sulfur subunit [Ktedonobacterales bacterium]|jgi:cytochrome b6-f complex iron-sulfur subunit|nr:ubiquinol-cytochrome c reductase iron-sulfur subunit [Ktedonobacterales bacterium]